eukprot:COSAG02_NODE_10168_length_2003_cov_3.507612_4_plen_60_part_00
MGGALMTLEKGLVTWECPNDIEERPSDMGNALMTRLVAPMTWDARPSDVGGPRPNDPTP